MLKPEPLAAHGKKMVRMAERQETHSTRVEQQVFSGMPQACHVRIRDHWVLGLVLGHRNQGGQPSSYISYQDDQGLAELGWFRDNDVRAASR
jgi:hypothetical protein